RLGLDVTDPKDFPFIYKRLAALTAPEKTHIDDSEIVTGIMALPRLDSVVGRPRRSGRTLSPDAKPVPAITLDWTDALSVSKAWSESEDSAASTPPFRSLSTTKT